MTRNLIKYHKVLTVSDAFKKGVLYDKKVPKSEGVEYPQRKKEIMKLNTIQRKKFRVTGKLKKVKI